MESHFAELLTPEITPGAGALTRQRCTAYAHIRMERGR